jgi:flagellar basal-body rod modification protein FlgD
VSYTDETGATKTGLVTSVRLGTDSTEASAMVGGVAVSMGRITEVATTPTTTS